MENKELVQLMSDMMDSKLALIKEELKEINKRLDIIEKKQGVICIEVTESQVDVTKIRKSIDALNIDMNFVESATIKNINDIQSIKSLRS